MNWNEGNVFLITDFDDEMESSIVLPLIRQIQHQKLLRNGRIDLHINSFGGYAHLAFHMVSLIEMAKRDGITVRTIVPDCAYSAGSLLAVTGSPGERYIERNANHLIHYGSQPGLGESTPEQVVRLYDAKSRHFKRIRNHYVKYARVPDNDLDRLMNDDMGFLPAPKAIKWGLADKYMDKFDIGRTED